MQLKKNKLLFILFFLFACLFSGCSSSNATFESIDDLATEKIGVMTGSIYDDVCDEHFPNADKKYYTLMPDLVLALEKGKIDGYISEKPYANAAIWEGAKITYFDDVLFTSNAAYIFKKDNTSSNLLNEVNAYIEKCKEDGSLKELQDKWFSKNEPTELFDVNSLTGENGVIKIAVAPDLKPYVYLKNNMPTGYEVELIGMFAQEKGYKLEFAYMNFDGILPSVVEGKYDIGLGGFSITEERKESVDFSTSHASVEVVMTIRDETKMGSGNFFDNIKESFEKTFIRENRYLLILEGIGITLLICSSAVVGGTLIGFGLYLLSRTDNKNLKKVIEGIGKVYSRIIEGTPVVVILMILFYVIFGSVKDMSGIVVAIIGFAFIFGSSVYNHMCLSVSSVGQGQTEAAYALGYTKNQTFFRIILPQAMKIFVPSYGGSIVELIKATAVVGYIAVTDLTRMGDIIRSNTYEAFFPLITIAIIYFLLTWGFSVLLGLLAKRFEPKTRDKDKILKGVKR